MSVSAEQAIAAIARDFVASLSDAERFVLPWMHAASLRPGQRWPSHDWRSIGYTCGRGWGKSHAIACNVNARVMSGQCASLALIGPNEDRVDEAQIAFLVDTSPPWFKAERYAGTVRWPNGLVAEVFTSEAPNGPRGGNFELSWLSELVAWSPPTRAEAFANITTATRRGRAQYVWDSTSKGKNEAILTLESLHEADPTRNMVVRGTTFDNPLLSEKYLRDVCRTYTGQALDEELLGLVYAHAAGAHWTADVLEAYRVRVAPPAALDLVAVDPALSERADADETGIVRGRRARDGHVYVTHDDSGHHAPDAWARIVVDHCAAGAAGVVIERNHAGDLARHAVISEARTRRMHVERLEKGAAWPERRAGVIFLRDVHAALSKGSRAIGPATETRAGRVHLVGAFRQLEHELTTYVQGERGKSPNRYDAHNYLVSELAGLDVEAPADARADTRAAASVEAEVMRLLAGAKGRRVGL